MRTVVLISILSNTFARIDQVRRNLSYARDGVLLSTARNTRGVYCLDIAKQFSQGPNSTSFNTRLPLSKGEATLSPPLRHSLSLYQSQIRCPLLLSATIQYPGIAPSLPTFLVCHTANTAWRECLLDQINCTSSSCTL